MKGKYIITTDAWFYAPDGKLYRAVWGEVEVFDDNQVLGIKTNAKATNWYAKIGTDENHVIVAGCQIHYATKCEQKPEENGVDAYEIVGGKVIQYNRSTEIYFAIDKAN